MEGVAASRIPTMVKVRSSLLEKVSPLRSGSVASRMVPSFKMCIRDRFWIHLNMDYPFNLKGILYFPKINMEYESIEGTIKLYNNPVSYTHLELDEKLVKASQEYLKDQYKAEVEQWGYIDPARWNAFYAWLNENGLSEADLPENAGFSNDYLPE